MLENYFKWRARINMSMIYEMLLHTSGGRYGSSKTAESYREGVDLSNGASGQMVCHQNQHEYDLRNATVLHTRGCPIAASGLLPCKKRI
jgi:predicted metal-dependent phosphotriesterase family hydrolase